MALKSALQDVRETTLAAVAGMLGKLAYLASLKKKDGYRHWGMSRVYGEESSERALRTAHTEVVSGVLQEPISSLLEDLRVSSRAQGELPAAYIEEMRANFSDLLPEDRKDSSGATHLNSVLVALSALEKTRARATRSTS